MPAYFPFLLVTHIFLAISLFLPSILLPFALRTKRAAVDSDSRVVHGLLWAQSHGTVAIGVGLALTGSAADADELVQDTCERALRRSDQLRDGSRLDAWLYGIMRNRWTDEMRWRRLRTPKSRSARSTRSSFRTARASSWDS